MDLFLSNDYILCSLVNMDNINEFVVPYKGMVINFDEVEEWISVITLLVQDGNVVTMGEREMV